MRMQNPPNSIDITINASSSLATPKVRGKIRYDTQG